jgi:hypothetical protein
MDINQEKSSDIQNNGPTSVDIKQVTSMGLAFSNGWNATVPAASGKHWQWILAWRGRPVSEFGKPPLDLTTRSEGLIGVQPG